MMEINEPSGLADRLREQEECLPDCPTCKGASLYILEERLDPNYGVLGIVQRTLKCPNCGQLMVV